ncbi:MAG: hypothetical protein GY866_03235 [Proteobacteria bacterium]|nr:hypothetical protein [Pseudomonadota bacterium]
MKYGFFSLKEHLAGRKIIWEDPRNQDAEAKEALKRGFSLIRVKPGHGDEFLGCRIIPNSLLADRDLLVHLGFSMDDDPAVLNSKGTASQIADLKEKAYRAFKDELESWLKSGTDIDRASQYLIRIHREQKGGGRLVEIDRHQRRDRLEETLNRLKNDDSALPDLRQVAEATVFSR